MQNRKKLSCNKTRLNRSTTTEKRWNRKELWRSSPENLTFLTSLSRSQANAFSGRCVLTAIRWNTNWANRLVYLTVLNSPVRKPSVLHLWSGTAMFRYFGDYTRLCCLLIYWLASVITGYTVAKIVRQKDRVLTTLIGGWADGMSKWWSVAGRVSLSCTDAAARRRRRHLAEAVGRQRAHVAVVAHDWDADGSRGDASAGARRRVASAPRGGATHHVVVGTECGRRRGGGGTWPLQPLRQTVTPWWRQSRRRWRHGATAAAFQHSLVFAL